MQEDVVVVAAAAGILAEEASPVGFLDCTLKNRCFVVELSADVDVGCCALNESHRVSKSFFRTDM